MSATLSPLSLFCYVLGDDPQQIFPVKIAPTETVGDLKDAIKAKKSNTLKDVDADTLKLWKVSIPVDSRFKERIETSAFAEEGCLQPMSELSEIFPDSPLRKHVHIVIKPPADPHPSKKRKVDPDSTQSSDGLFLTMIHQILLTPPAL